MTVDTRAWLVAMLVAGKLATPSKAQPGPAGDGSASAPPAQTLAHTQPAPAQSRDDDDALAGPKVAEGSLGVSLVSRDFRGDFQRLNEPAEEAALRLLPLTDAEKAATQKILTERAAILDGVVGDNLVLLLRLQGFKDEGATPDRMAALREMTEKLAPLRQRGRLRDELASAMSAEHAKEFRRIVDGYWEALIDSELAKERRAKKSSSNTKGAKDTQDATLDDAMMERGDAMASDAPLTPADRALRRQIVVRETLQATGAELKRAFDRRIADGTAKLEEALKVIDATPEQGDAIRNKVLKFYQETLGKPTPQQRASFFREIMKDLTPTQRKALVKNLYGGGAGDAK